jgi:hypothetical protein
METGRARREADDRREHGEPVDCVREFPTLSPDTVELVAFDWRGLPRFRTELPVIEDLESWSTLMLRRTRRLFPPPWRPLELLG